VIRHKEVASQKADVYSFGIILYELIGKSGPFGAGYQYSDKDLQGGTQQIGFLILCKVSISNFLDNFYYVYMDFYFLLYCSLDETKTLCML